ncbi:Small RNA degrading nuclease 5 [Tetrabaena socialis]|uniref:Small RNA degrading nuclease 5 n=1 Tax=Tetrabaena socialis TaxID=47790 RepID=A0A2J7ZWU3_9CHLO|nr:Small RNA degrading nuclease 5 [Tetrabaena socialis]|eukprot:PNH04739.1 Small RNA degrading nuclease 5 [Tetrabaena socialis]
MKGKGHSRPQADSDLEDGELPEEQQPAPKLASPPRKQRKLQHGQAGEARPHEHSKHGAGDAGGGRSSGAGAALPGTRHTPHQPKHRAGGGGADGRAANGATGASGGGGGGGRGRGGAAAAAPSPAFAAHKEALKARLEGLVAEEGGEAGGAEQAAAARGGRAHGAGGGGAGGGGQQYVAAVYKDLSPSVEVKPAQAAQLPHYLRQQQHHQHHQHQQHQHHQQQPEPEGGWPAPGASIRLADVQSLVLWALSEGGNVVEAPRWAFVKERLLRLLPAESLLVGHALENDLAALRTCHGRVLDTALLFPHPKGPPFKSALKILARRFLRRSIQEGSHDSAVDARTALDLALLKIKHGGCVCGRGPGPSYGTGSSGPHSAAPKLADVLASQCDVRCCLVDRHDVLARFVTGVTAAIPVASDDDAVAAAGRQAAGGTYKFVWTQQTELATFLFRRSKHKARLEEKAADEAAEGAHTGAAATPAAGSPSKRTATPNGPGCLSAGPGRPVAAPLSFLVHAAPAAAGASALEVVAAAGHAGGAAVEEQAGGHGAPLSPSSAADYSDAVLEALLRAYDNRLRRLYEQLPQHWLVVVTTGAGDTAEYGRLYELKCKRCSQDSGLPAWTQAEELALNEMAASVMQGLCFAKVV